MKTQKELSKLNKAEFALFAAYWTGDAGKLEYRTICDWCHWVGKPRGSTFRSYENILVRADRWLLSRFSTSMTVSEVNRILQRFRLSRLIMHTDSVVFI